MRRWQGLDEVPDDWGRSVVTIGVFDGVHRGHQRIVATARERARAAGLPTVVITFDPHPQEVVRPGTHPPLLTSPRRRVELLADLGVDAVLVLPFTYALSQVGPEEFVRTTLVDRLHAAAVVVGENFRFGNRARGDVALLTELGEKYDFTATGVALVTSDGIISSTSIRACLTEGDVAAASAALGRPHRVEGIVVRGHRRGRALGFPTANLEPPPHTAVPRDGVYAGYLVCDSVDYPGARWPAAISIGTNPQFGDTERSVEGYALDRDDLDLYGSRVGVDFVAWLRETTTFASVQALVEQMHRDVARTRTVLAGE